MRILVITWNYPPKTGGMEMMMHQLIKHISPYSKIDIIGPFSPEKPTEKKSDSICRPQRDGLLWFFCFSVIRGIKLLFANKYDIILAGSTLLVPVSVVLGKMYKVPVVANVYGLDLIYPQPLYQLLVKSFLNRCDRIIAISEAAKNEAVKRGCDISRVHIIPPGIQFEEFEKEPELGNIKERLALENRFIILSAGRLARRKGIFEFIENSLPAIVHKHPEVLFVIVGENPVHSLAHKENMRRIIENEVVKLALEKNVLMLGQVARDELIQLFFASDVFVLPGIEVKGDMEGFGIVLIEASAAGKPVVASRIGGISDAVENEKSGFLVPVGNWDKFSSTIMDIIGSSTKAHSIGEYGRSRARNQFDWSIIGKRYMNVLAAIKTS